MAETLNYAAVLDYITRGMVTRGTRRSCFYETGQKPLLPKKDLNLENWRADQLIYKSHCLIEERFSN